MVGFDYPYARHYAEMSEEARSRIDTYIFRFMHLLDALNDAPQREVTPLYRDLNNALSPHKRSMRKIVLSRNTSAALQPAFPRLIRGLPVPDASDPRWTPAKTKADFSDALIWARFVIKRIAEIDDLLQPFVDVGLIKTTPEVDGRPAERWVKGGGHTVITGLILQVLAERAALSGDNL